MQVRTVSAISPSRSAIALATIAQHRSICAAASPGVVDPSGSIGAVPATMIWPPVRTARENPRIGSSGEPLLTRRFIGSPHRRDDEGVGGVAPKTGGAAIGPALRHGLDLGPELYAF